MGLLASPLEFLGRLKKVVVRPIPVALLPCACPFSQLCLLQASEILASVALPVALVVMPCDFRKTFGVSLRQLEHLVLVHRDLSVLLRAPVLACCGELAQPSVVRTCSSLPVPSQGRGFAV